jgi:hypothetical protein
LTPLTSTIRKVHDASDGDREKPEFERPVTTIGGDAKQSFDEVHGVFSPSWKRCLQFSLLQRQT